MSMQTRSSEKKDFQVPYHYARCLQTTCQQGENCLRRLAALNDTKEETRFFIINPQCVPQAGKDCTYFHSAQKQRVAWGIKHLLDNVPYKVAPVIKATLIAHFGRGRYYRYYREEIGLYPEEQAYIARLFKQYGIEGTPAFDGYSDEYKW